MLDILLGRIKQPPFFSESGGTAILLKLDACLTQSHKYANHATSYPVESGLDITDHIRQEPETFSIKGIVTNSPVMVFSLFNSASSPTELQTIVNEGKDRVTTAYEALLLIVGRRMTGVPERVVNTTEEIKPKLVDIQANLRVYNDMIIENLVFDFDEKTGDALPFTADAKRIRKVTTAASTINFTNSNGAIGAAGVTDQVDESQKGVQEAPGKIKSWAKSIESFSVDSIKGK